MSLLLDALKRAEQEKIARGDRPDLQIVGQAEPAAAPAARPHANAAALAASLELQPIASPPAATGAKSPSPSQAALNVFQAKTQAAQDKPRRVLLYAAAGAIVIALIAAGAYVWYAMKSLSPAAAPRPAAAPMAAPASGTVAPAAAGPPTSPLPAPASAEVAAPKKDSAPQSTESIAADLIRQAPVPRDPPVRLDRTQSAPRVPAEISTAYEALRKGDFAAALRGYQAALANDATNLDAALGMATLEARAGNIAAATAHYRRVIDLDPRNATALAGLAALADPSRPGAVEARLREDLIRYPPSAALRFALGNVYAAQSRWSEAQAEYFEAHRLDPAGADIAHNLAVSLDNLGQARLAAEFYRRALEAARTQPSQFDPAPAARRLAELGS